MKKFLKPAILLGVMALILLPQVVSAATLGNLGIEYASSIGLGTQDIRTTIATIISVLMGLLGIIAVVIILAGGLFWMTAMGDQDKVKKAKNLIFDGIIGLLIILSAYAIANFVISNILTATTSH